MKKFTIANKPEAQEILENNPSLSQEDKELLDTKPVFSVLKSLFEKYYNVELLSAHESSNELLSFTTKPIEKYWPNTKESYVSMIRCYDHLVFGSPKETPESAQKYLKKPNIMKKYLNEEEVESTNPELHAKIEEYINEHIVNWGESCETEAEGEALEYFGDGLRIFPTYRVYPDGSITVEMNPGQSTEDANRSFLTFEWEEENEEDYDEDDEDDEDDDREPETSHGFFFDYLRGNVTLKFNDEDETGDDSFGWDKEIEEEVIALFK